MTESKKHSLKSVALTIQQHKNEVLHKQLRNSEVNKCNQQSNHLKKWKHEEKWKHLKKQWWKTLKDSPNKTGVFKLKDEKFHFLKYKVFHFLNSAGYFLKHKEIKKNFPGFPELWEKSGKL